jgi:thiol-disulfide isomerase/thioredoxin
MALAAGCGGSGSEEPSSYALAPTRACLQSENGVEVNTRDVDFVASTALGGAMRVKVSPVNFVVMAFGDDEAEAQRIEQAYREFAGQRIPIDDVLERRKNLVLVWNAPPTGEDEGAIANCLKGAG